MKKDELLEAMEDGRTELIEMLEDLPDETMVTPGVVGEWSIKDLLAHMTHWEGQLITLLFQARQGMKKPTTVHFGQETTDEINQRWWLASRERPLEIIWNDFTGIRKQTIRRVNEFNENELNATNLYPWQEGRSLWQWIFDDTVEHDQEHGDQIYDWLEQREAKNNGNRTGG